MSPSMAMTMNPAQSMNIFGRPLSIFGVPVDRETIFSNHRGVYQNRIEKRQRKLIIKTTFIKFFLHADERILCLTRGYSPVSVKDQIMTGPAFLFCNRAIFVFTDKRILHVSVGTGNSKRRAVSQIRYTDCSALDIKGRSLIVMYKNGTRECFPYIGRKEKKKIASILDNVDCGPSASDGYHKRVYLCPSCTNPINDAATCCHTCQLEFKSQKQAKLRAYLIPGGGYFYNHYNVFGVALGLFEIGLFSHLLFNLVAFKQGLAVNMITMTVLLALLVYEKIVAAFHAQQLTRDRIPETNDYALRKR